MIDERQRLLVKSCGDVFMFYIIDWNVLQSYFEMKYHGTVFHDPTIIGADEAFRVLCDIERSETK